MEEASATITEADWRISSFLIKPLTEGKVRFIVMPRGTEMLELTPIDKIREECDRENSIVEKSITDVDVKDITVHLDKSQDVSKQAEQLADLMSTARVIQDEDTQSVLASSKKSELIDRSQSVLASSKKSELIDRSVAKVKAAQKGVIEAETEVQKAEQESYEGLLTTFGFFHHLPRWLTKILVYCLTPFFLVIGFVIGIPCGLVKILIENIEGIIVKYQKTDDNVKPRIRVTIWILFALICLAAICFTVLGCLHII